MYTRVNERKTGDSKIKIPDNYSGNAFGGQNYYFHQSDSPPVDSYKTPENPPDTTQKEIAERQIPEEKTENVTAINPLPKEKTETVTAINTLPKEKTETVTAINPLPKEKNDTLLSSLFPSRSLKNHFPFGHGIGSEEILILGIMSLIFFSDDNEPDGELIMLLALLLFAG